MIIQEVKNYKYGTIDTLEDNTIPDGAASRSLNWLTKGDRIELRRGSSVLGTVIAGSGRCPGVFTGHTASGTEVLFRKRISKLEYYDSITEDWIEIGADVYGSAAANEDVAFAEYQSTAGAQVWSSSPNSTVLLKIMVNSGKSTNPPTSRDQYNSAKNFLGYIRIKYNRMTLWNRLKDKSGLYGSYIDTLTNTVVTAEAIGIAGATNYAGNLAAVTGKRTCFAVVITDGTETFSDDFNGVLTGSLGGSGTINYATGAYNVNFNAAAAGPVTADYQWEDSTNQGIADFTKSGTRTAGQGFIFRQDTGGALQTVHTYGDGVDYCFHEKETYTLELTIDDTGAKNLPFWERVGIPNWRAAVPTGNGIYYIDDTDKSATRIKRLTLNSVATQVVPVVISNNLNLNDYRFEKAAGAEWGDYILFACRHKNSAQNNAVIAYHKLWKSLDKLDYYVANFAILNGVLYGADSVSYNVFELFSGFDDDDAVIGNYWEGNLTRNGIEELKKTKRLILEGLIAPDQNFDVSLSLDRGPYVLVGNIDGRGSYVDFGNAVSIGAATLGRKLLGGGSELVEDIVAYPYEHALHLRLDKYEWAKIRIEAKGVGYVSQSAHRYFDIRRHGPKIPRKYR